MRSVLFFVLGLIIGGTVSTTILCAFQINKMMLEENKTIEEKPKKIKTTKIANKQ